MAVSTWWGFSHYKRLNGSDGYLHGQQQSSDKTWFSNNAEGSPYEPRKYSPSASTGCIHGFMLRFFPVSMTVSDYSFCLTGVEPDVDGPPWWRCLSLPAYPAVLPLEPEVWRSQEISRWRSYFICTGVVMTFKDKLLGVTYRLSDRKDRDLLSSPAL